MPQVAVSGLGLGDVVQLFQGAYGTATVFKISDKQVHLWRPYVTTTDFSMSAGSNDPNGSQVIPYIGIETVILWVDDTRKLKLLEKAKKPR